MSSWSHHCRNSLTPLRAWLLALLLLAAQSAGLAHRIVHAPSRIHATLAIAATVPGAHAAPFQGIGADHQAGSSDCRLIDQLMHADALCAGVSVSVATAPPSAVEPRLIAQAARAAAPAHYLARAPPRA